VLCKLGLLLVHTIVFTSASTSSEHVLWVGDTHLWEIVVLVLLCVGVPLQGCFPAGYDYILKKVLSIHLPPPTSS
jgi:hypothetical protein